MDTQLSSNLQQLENLFASRMGAYEDKLKKVASDSTTLHPDFTALSKDFNEFKSFVMATLSNIKSQLELISLGLDRHETAMRRKVLLIHGIPEKQNENLHSTVLALTNDQLKLTDFKTDCVSVCHRLGASQGKPRPVLVRFMNMESRQAVWDSKTSLKGTGVTISEFLTKIRHGVFLSARKHFGVQRCWSADGKIVLVLPDKSRYKIESMNELQALIKKYPIICTDTVESAVQGKPSTPKPADAHVKTITKMTRKGRR